MLKRKLFKTLLGISAGLMFAPMAMATCTPTSLYGSCLWLTGSVRCDNLNAVGIGSTNIDTKTMNCTVDQDPTATDPQTGALLPIPGVLFCSNKGGNVAPGVNAFANDGFTGATTIPNSAIDTNGTVGGINVEAFATDQLAGMDQYCQNPNWSAIDFVPSHFFTTVYVKDETTGDILSTSTYECDLPDAATLAWDKKANRPEQRQYNCTRQ